MVSVMSLLVEDLMSSLARSAMPETSLAEVMSLMRFYHVDCLPVAFNRRLIGYVRLKDILDMFFSEDALNGTDGCKDMSSLQNSNTAIIRADIRRVILDNVISVSPTTPVDEAMSIMQGYMVSSLAVTEADELVGMVSLDDINRAITGQARTRVAA